jgi:hypothetical protein
MGGEVPAHVTNSSGSSDKICGKCGIAFYETREVESAFCSKCEGRLQNKKALRVVIWVIIGGNLAGLLLLLLFLCLLSRHS